MSRIVFVGNVAGDPIFIPGADPNKNHTMVTVLENIISRGKQFTTRLSCHFWGKAANMAANFLYPGKEIFVEGQITTFSADTGETTPAGKRKIDTNTSIRVTRCKLLGDSLKYRTNAFNNAIMALKAAGRMPQDVNIAFEEVQPRKSPMIDYNPAATQQTGKYGHARVWMKGVGFVGPQTAMPANMTNAASMTPAEKAAKVQQLTAELAALSSASSQEIAGVDNGGSLF